MHPTRRRFPDRALTAGPTYARRRAPLDNEENITDFDEIVEKYGDFVYNVAFKMMQKPEDAEDVA